MNWLPEKTDEERIQHSDLLDSDNDLYGEGKIVAYEIDLGFKDNGDGMTSWTEGTEFFRQILEEEGGWDGHSAGTGFGIRDMQFGRTKPLSKTEFDELVRKAKAEGIALEYFSQHGVNEWGEQTNEDNEFSFGLETE